MKRRFFVSMSICLICLMLCNNIYSQDKKTVAVVPATGEEIRQTIKDGVTEGLLEGIVKSRQYRPVARDKDFEKALKEMKFQQSGAVADGQMIQFGKALRADLVCHAWISKYSEQEFRITYKIIDVASSEILDMSSETVRDGTSGLLKATDNIANKLFGEKRDKQTPATKSDNSKTKTSETKTSDVKETDPLPSNGILTTFKDLGLMVLEKDLGFVNWFEAKKICAELNRGGYTDFYLPSKTELLNIFDAKDKTFMKKIIAVFYWSSTEIDDKKAYYVSRVTNLETPSNKKIGGTPPLGPNCICVRKINK